MPLAYWLLFLIGLLDLTLIASPWLVGDADPVIVVWTTVDTARQAIPYAAVGVLGVPALVYLAGLLAAGQAAVARRLLDGAADSTALREVARSRARLVDAYEAERRRIERDVHDGAQPRLTSLTLQLGLARLDVPDDSPAARPLAVAHEQAKGLMITLRQIVQGIRPQHLTELGLAGAVRELAGAATIPVDVHADLGQPLPEVVETTAYFVVSEALGNIARHARAGRAEVRLTRSAGSLVVEIEDDGCGDADPARGSGLTGLADRVAAVDGRLLLSSPPGGPTLVRVELPCRPVTRVVLAEDEVLLREGLVGLLTRFDFEVVAAVGSAPALLERGRRVRAGAGGDRHQDAAAAPRRRAARRRHRAAPGTRTSRWWC